MPSRTTINTSSSAMPMTENYVLDYTEIDQGLNLWSEILPMIEKQIVTLTNVAQEMQECSERQKYTDALMKIAVRVNDVEDKAMACIKEARTQLKKTKFVDKVPDNQEKSTRQKVRDNNDSENEDDDESEDGMEIDESQTDEQVEVSALNTENLEKLQTQLNKILNQQSDSNIEADDRYTDFLECLSKLKDDENDSDD